MPMVFVESLEEFAAKNGGNAVEEEGRWLFPTGAMTDRQGFMRWEPPADEHKRLKAIRLYWQVRVEAAERAFHALKSDLQYRASWAARGAMPGPTANDAAVLKELKSNVVSLRRSLAKVERELENTPEEVARQRRAEIDARLRQEQSSMLNEIRSIQL